MRSSDRRNVPSVKSEPFLRQRALTNTKLRSRPLLLAVGVFISLCQFFSLFTFDKGGKENRSLTHNSWARNSIESLLSFGFSTLQPASKYQVDEKMQFSIATNSTNDENLMQLFQTNFHNTFRTRCSSITGWSYLKKWKEVPAKHVCGDEDNYKQTSGNVRHMRSMVQRREFISYVELNRIRVVIDSQNRDEYLNRSTAVIQVACSESLSWVGELSPSFLILHRFAKMVGKEEWLDSGNKLDKRPLPFSRNRDTSCAFASDHRTSDGQFPVAILMHREFHDNVYHMLESVHGAIQTALLADLDPRKVPILFIDDGGPHPLDVLFTVAFGNEQMNVDPHLLLHKRDAQKGRGDGGMCFQRAIIGLSCGNGPALRNTFLQRDVCGGQQNEMVKEFTQYVLSRMGMLHILPPSPLPSIAQLIPEMKVLFLDRSLRGQKAVGNENDERRIMLHTTVDAIGYEIEEGLKREGIDGNYPYTVKFDVWNPRGASLTEQIARIRSYNVILGLHGAALAHLAFQADQDTGIIEIKPEHHVKSTDRKCGFCARHIYPNMASWYGRPYRSISLTEPLPNFSDSKVKEVSKVVHGMLARIASDARQQEESSLQPNSQNKKRSA